MAKWSDYATWTDKSQINKGQTYSNGDGIKVADINALVTNVLYLKRVLDASQGGK
jgi:hypothetical protein